MSGRGWFLSGWVVDPWHRYPASMDAHSAEQGWDSRAPGTTNPGFWPGAPRWALEAAALGARGESRV